MFSPLGLFKAIQCPEGDKCSLPVCIFLHETITVRTDQPSLAHASIPQPADTSEAISEPPRKRQRLEDGPGSRVPIKHQASKATTNTLQQKGSQEEPRPAKSRKLDKVSSNSNIFENLRADVSPPPLNRSSKEASTQSQAAQNGNTKIFKLTSGTTSAAPRKVVKKETLNPRLLSKPPAGHALRFKLLTLVHEQMVRLNEEVKRSSEPFKQALQLDANELISLALDEEEQTAKSNGSVYPNVMKLRVVALKKFKLEDWKAERLKQIKRDNPGLVSPGERRGESKKNLAIDTKLPAEAEIALLPNLVTPQTGLDSHGYVPVVPSAAAIEEARKGVEAARNWEVCDRCKSRFQVFPGRRESDGALTTGGSCKHHWGRARRPPREKNEPVRPEQYTCCRQEIGTPGCTTSSAHVFKISEAKRLALVLPFERTPIPSDKHAKEPICFDCEMGYTAYGMELIRLTAVSWPSGAPLLDVLVRPLGEVLDLNSRFSGVWPEAFTSAKPWNSMELPPAPLPRQDATKPDSEAALYIVPNPAHARSLLFGLLTPNTPLIGHALENDLNAVRIVHPTIIDTVLLYPHPAGLPARQGLKNLVKKEIEWDIQTGGEMGHDSMEDSRAAGELVRLAVKRKWIEMKREGWSIGDDGIFHAP